MGFEDSLETHQSEKEEGILVREKKQVGHVAPLSIAKGKSVFQRVLQRLLLLLPASLFSRAFLKTVAFT